MDWFRAIFWLILTLAILSGSTVDGAHAAQIRLPPLEPGNCIQDTAGLIAEEDEVAIREMAATLQAEQDMPLVVVTIKSMIALGWSRGSIESFARALFEQWGRDPEFAFAASGRRGILLVVSEGDRKARIELGADWAGQYDEQCQRIMDQLMVPAFEDGNFSHGIYRGVSGLVGMSRGEELPNPLWKTLLLVALAIVGLPGMIIGGLYAEDLLAKKMYPVAYAERMEWLRLEEARAANRRKRRRRKKSGDYDDEHLRSSSGYDSSAGGGGGATGSW